MTQQISFEPFVDRLSRDIRNDLSETIFEVLKQRSLAPAEYVAQDYKQRELSQCYIDYIDQRLGRYGEVLANEPAVESGDVLWQSLVLWDQELFFEVHEVLEKTWLGEKGAAKLFYQAMIRAAAVYIKLEYDYRQAAEKIAAKAIPVLEDNFSLLGKYCEPEKLITALSTLQQPPPKLLDK